jgi:hypothetical protein
MINSSRFKLMKYGDVARMRKKKTAYKRFIGNPEGLLGRLRRGRVGNIVTYPGIA